ncbi:MAG: phosphate/phosphite/phosphonate ABC transporter substrate-binding protein [Candidatus Sulfobium sp.]|jgi:phosphate/phosphite/phosphonate ABC transporter binding protein
MRATLEVKILALVAFLLLIGVAAAGVMVMTIEKASLYGITESSSEAAANIIARDIERTMLDGRADITKELIHDLKGTSGVNEISVLDYEGRPAFDKSAAATEKSALRQIGRSGKPFLVRGVKQLTFYKPLINSGKCRECHAGDPEVLGAVKASMSIEKEYNSAVKYIKFVIVATILASLFFSFILWAAVRRTVISPIRSLESAALKLSGGDLTFDVDLKSRDEIGRLGREVRDSLVSISGILGRIKDVSGRVSRVAEDVEKESRQVVNGTMLETEAVNNISSSVEEMNAGMTEIADGTDGLAASAEETAASMEQMVTSISEIKGSTEDLSMAVESASTSIGQLSAAIKEVSDNAGELAESAEETQAAIIEISTSIKEVEQRTKESAMLSDKVKNEAVTFGMTSIEKTIDGMKNIKSSVEKTACYIEKLGGRSEEIGKILVVIDEVTDQTTMLALNAAILAAQAGEHGKGFTVVADEIKNLADRTAASTQEIAELIQAVRQEVSDASGAMNEGLRSVETGFKVTNEAVDALRKIVESSRKSSEMTAAIEQATAEQSKAAKFVSSAMEKVLGMAGQIARATTEQNRGIQLIMNATQKISDVTIHVKTATNEQSMNSKQISQAVELVSDKSQQMSRAVNEQKVGSSQIRDSVQKIRDLPRENRERAFRLNQMVKDLMKDAELAVTEMGRFTFAERTSSGLLKMGIVPLEAPAVMFKKFNPLAEYLGGVLKRRIDLRVAVDFEGAVEDIGKGTTQICFMTPSTYVEAHRKYGVRVLVKALTEGKPFHHAVIVTRNDSGIDSLEDLRGRSFAFGDLHSTSSHIVPRAMLLEAGVDLKDLQYYNYLGHHDDVARAVVSGDFDAGGIMESTAEKFRGEGLKFLMVSEDIPEFNICVADGVEPGTVAELTNALVSLHEGTPEGAAILKSINIGYTGFAPSSDEDYDSVRKMMSKIGLA